MEKLICSLLGYFLGFIFSLVLWGKTEGSAGIVPNLRFILLGRDIALHHWILFLALTIILLLLRQKIELPDKIFYLFLGFSIGGLNQGLSYRDWFTIFK